jgi:hypothetical protein
MRSVPQRLKRAGASGARRREPPEPARSARARGDRTSSARANSWKGLVENASQTNRVQAARLQRRGHSSGRKSMKHSRRHKRLLFKRHPIGWLPGETETVRNLDTRRGPGSLFVRQMVPGNGGCSRSAPSVRLDARRSGRGRKPRSRRRMRTGLPLSSGSVVTEKSRPKDSMGRQFKAFDADVSLITSRRARSPLTPDESGAKAR